MHAVVAFLYGMQYIVITTVIAIHTLYMHVPILKVAIYVHIVATCVWPVAFPALMAICI